MSNELMTRFSGNAELAAKLAEAGISGPTSFSVQEAEESSGVKASRFFPFLQLLQRTSNAVGDYKPGTYLFKRTGQDKEPVNLGDSFEGIIVAIRGKSTYYDGETVHAEYHTPAQQPSEKYKEFMQKAKEDTSVNSKHRAGLDVLIWIKELRSFATYFANTVSTTANVETMLVPFAPRTGTDFVPVRVLSQGRSNKKGNWFVPSAAELPKDVSDLWEEKDLFTSDNLAEALKLFLIPPKAAESAEGNIEGAEAVDTTVRQKRQR